MTLDALTPAAADLDIAFTEPTNTPIDQTLEALRAFRLVGLVEADAEGRGGSVSATLAYVPERGLLVDAGDTLQATPAQPILDALAARLRADVMLDTADDVFGATPTSSAGGRDDVAGDAADDEDAAGSADRGAHADPQTTVFVVGGTLATGRERQAELALQLESSLTMAPLGTRTLVVADSVDPMSYWDVAQRPVIALHRRQHQLMVQLYSTGPAKTGRMRDRLAARTMSNWIGVWDPAPIPIAQEQDGVQVTESTPASTVPSPLAVPSAAMRAQAHLAAERVAQIAGVGVAAADDLAEAGIDGAALGALLGRDLDDDVVNAVLAALRLPREVGDVLEGRVAAADLPGATAIEYRGVRGAIADSLLVEPDGDSLLAKWRRVPHRRPALAVTLIVVELGLAAALAVGALSAAVTQPWTAILWVGAAVLAVDAVGDALLLAKIRRRQ